MSLLRKISIFIILLLIFGSYSYSSTVFKPSSNLKKKSFFLFEQLEKRNWLLDNYSKEIFNEKEKNIHSLEISYHKNNISRKMKYSTYNYNISGTNNRKYFYIYKYEHEYISIEINKNSKYSFYILFGQTHLLNTFDSVSCNKGNGSKDNPYNYIALWFPAKPEKFFSNIVQDRRTKTYPDFKKPKFFLWGIGFNANLLEFKEKNINLFMDFKYMVNPKIIPHKIYQQQGSIIYDENTNTIKDNTTDVYITNLSNKLSETQLSFGLEKIFTFLEFSTGIKWSSFSHIPNIKVDKDGNPTNNWIPIHNYKKVSAFISVTTPLIFNSIKLNTQVHFFDEESVNASIKIIF